MGYSVSCLTNCISYGTDEFDSVYFYHNEGQFKNVMRDIGHLFQIVTYHTEPFYQPKWFDQIRKECGFNFKLVIDHHDIDQIRLGRSSADEISMFNVADGHVFVSDPIEKEMKELFNFKQPSVVFEHYCNKEWNGYTNYVPGDDDIKRRHGIVYQGGINPPDHFLNEEQRRMFRYRTMYYLFKEAVAQGNEVIIFAGNPQGYETHLDIGATVFPPTQYDQMMKKLQDYKWGWCLFGEKESNQTKLTTCNKYFEYIKAGCVPIICWAGETARLAKEYGCGIVLNDPTELGNIEKNLGHLYKEHKNRCDEINKTGYLDSENHIFKIENLWKSVLNNKQA